MSKKDKIAIEFTKTDWQFILHCVSTQNHFYGSGRADWIQTYSNKYLRWERIFETIYDTIEKVQTTLVADQKEAQTCLTTLS